MSRHANGDGDTNGVVGTKGVSGAAGVVVRWVLESEGVAASSSSSSPILAPPALHTYQPIVPATTTGMAPTTIHGNRQGTTNNRKNATIAVSMV